jgi:GNAT superfamily N-acetyltransferase
MSTIRFAGAEDLEQQKILWRLCFGGTDRELETYYGRRYREDQTLLLFHQNQIAAMLTMLPVSLVWPQSFKEPAVMIFAVGTHPQHRGQGFASELIGFCDRYLINRKIRCSVLVPAEESLFGFYARYGYRTGFVQRRCHLTGEEIEAWQSDSGAYHSIRPLSPEEYNRCRNQSLEGTAHIAYSEEDMDYQKALSEMSGADLYGLDLEGIKGCAAIERSSAHAVVIKELLLPDAQLQEGLKLIARKLPAGSYQLRLPAYAGKHLKGSVEPFAMLRVHGDADHRPEQPGYLGIAFD